MALGAALCGALIAAGVLAVVAGWRGWADGPPAAGESSLAGLRARAVAFGRLDRIGWSAAAALAALVLTGWPVAAVLGAVGGWLAVTALSSREEDPAARAEAIALWAEILRDALGTSWEIETVLRATAPTAPRLIRDDVMRATGKLGYAPLEEVLDELAARLGGGTGDLVIVALRLAASSGGRQVRDVLDTTARTAYNEAEMLRRVAVARQSPRTSTRLVTGITVVAVLGTVLLFRDWVEPYGTASGQVALGVIAAWCGGALWWMSRMTDVRLPARFTARQAGADR